MSTPIRGTEAVKAMRDLFSEYLDECERIDAYKSDQYSGDDVVAGRFNITREEMIEVFERRRDAIAAKLENKGFKVTTDTGADTLPSIAKAQAEMGS